MKKFKTFLVVLMVVACLFTTLAIAISAEETTGTEEKTITISYINTQDPSSTTTSLDTVAHADGKITVKAGEKFTLPTTANSTYVGQEGYVLVWYTENGRTYKAGEEVSFEEDTRLLRCVAKECATAAEVKSAMSNNSHAAILTADIESTDTIGHWYQNQAVLVLNDHTFTITRNGTIMGDIRTGNNVIGKGTLNCKVTNNSYGSYNVFNSDSHGWFGDNNKTVVGVDVTLNAPNFRLTGDGQGWVTSGYPLVRIYGKVNVYTLGYVNNGNKNPRIEFYEDSEVTIAAPSWISDSLDGKYNGQSFKFTIKGGKFNLPKEAESIHFWTTDFKSYDTSGTYNVNALTTANRDEFNITGGSFSVMLPDGLLKNGYKCVYNNETGYYDVVYVACTTEGSEGTHTYVVSDSCEGMVSSCDGMGLYYFRCECGSYYADTVEAVGHDYSVLVSETPATCTAKAYKTYKCIRCDSTQNVEYGEALGHDYSIVTIEKLATLAENGVKRFTCARCADTYTIEYSFDPSEQIISVVVKSGEGTKTISIATKDLYEIDGNTLTGIKSFVDPDDTEVTYAVTDLIEISISAGFTDLSAGAISGATALQKITLLDNANITLATGSIKNCSALTTIIVGEATVVFKSGVLSSCSAFTTLNLEKANATFEITAFQNSSIQHLKLGSGKTYSFGKNSFKNAKLTEMTFPDGSSITFAGEATFYGCTQLKYVYFGTGTGAQSGNYSNAIVNKPFDCCYAIETLVLMDIDYINEYVFCTDGNANSGTSYKERVANGLAVYHHGSSLAINDNAFANRGVYGVKLYTASSVTSLKNCLYTIYSGIPHAYTAVTEAVEPTCTTSGSKANGYVTDCPCGALSDATYTIYSTLDTSINQTSDSVSFSDADGDLVIPATGHKFTIEEGATVVATTEATCLKNGTITYKCANCDETQTIDDETKPAIGHDIEGLDYTVSIEAECTKQGLKVKNCKNCMALVESEAIEAIGHNVEGVEWTKISDSTCTLAGTEVKYCSTCNAVVETQAIDAIGHTEGEWVTTLDPDCDDTGLKEKKCTICGVLIATEVIPVLGHEYEFTNGAEFLTFTYPNGFNRNGTQTIKCANCTIIGSFDDVAPLFVAKGYSTNSTYDALDGGFTVDTDLLALYEQFNGTITYGIVIANAGSFGENSFFDENNNVNSSSAIQAPITMKNYSNFDCTLGGFGASSSTLELIITAYVIDENGNASFIQAENDYAIEITVGQQTFTKVTIDLVVANVVGDQPDALLPSEEE